MLEGMINKTARKPQQCSLELSATQRLSIRVKGKRPEVLDYELQQTLGVGSFGIVRKAVHRLTGQTVAVKICAMDEDRLAAEQIALEIELQRELIHKNIAKVYEVVQHEGKIHIFMEYCCNGELYSLIGKNRTISEKEAARISFQILSALIYLKANKLSHRDIKPENVLFDSDWNVKLIDFGFCCRREVNKMRKTACGTPSYSPPEVIKRVVYDPQLVDVWSFGVTLYAMVAGHLPFQGLNIEERLKNVLAYRFKQLPAFSPSLQKLFSSIFVEARQRPRLSDLLISDFFTSYASATTECINANYESPDVEEKVMSMIEKVHKVAVTRVTRSVLGKQFDKFNALYYLTLKSMQRSDPEISLFKKQRRSSLVKLQPISRTPILKAKPTQEYLLSLKTGQVNTKHLSKQKLKMVFDAKAKNQNRNQPDSPRKLLDCLMAYKQS